MYWWLVIAAPPFAPAVKAIEAEPLPAVATSPVGADGTLRGVTATEADAAPAPAALAARSCTLYGVPLVRPGMVTGLAVSAGAVSLAQGFPDFPCDPKLLDLVNDAMREGLNQYPPMTGVAPLREAVSKKIENLYGRHYDPASEITVTAGATQAILTIILAIVHSGDEVIVLEPCYDSYVPNIELAGGVVVRVPLTPGTFRPDFDKIRAAITPQTRAILINSPHNPSGMIWSKQDMLTLQEILEPTNIVLISDEVYEHMVYAPNQHWSAAHFDGLAARAFIVSSFGKTYHVTGWKIGTVAAPAASWQSGQARVLCAPARGPRFHFPDDA